jgi:hypothetical protein
MNNLDSLGSTESSRPFEAKTGWFSEGVDCATGFEKILSGIAEDISASSYCGPGEGGSACPRSPFGTNSRECDAQSASSVSSPKLRSPLDAKLRLGCIPVSVLVSPESVVLNDYRDVLTTLSGAYKE